MFLGFLLLAPALATGCVRMRPLDDVRSDLATGQVLTIGEQSVYVERRAATQQSLDPTDPALQSTIQQHQS